MSTSLHPHARSIGLLTIVCALFIGSVFAGNRLGFGGDKGRDPLHVLMIQETGSNAYAGGQYVFSPADAPKDVLTVGQQINYNHNIGGDGLFGGAQVVFGPAATIYGDLRVAAGQFASAANIKGDLLVAAGNITLDANSIVDGLTLLAGGDVLVQGKLNGNTRIFADRVTFDAQAARNVMIKAKSITFGSSASIKGDLSYYAKAIAGNVDEVTAGTVTGGIMMMTKGDKDGRRGGHKSMYFGTMGRMQSICMLSIIVLSLLLYLPLRKVREHHQSETILKTPGTSFLIGLLTYLLMPLVAILLMITLIGFPIGLLLLVIYPFLFVLSGIVNTCSFLGILHKGLPQSGWKARVGLVGATIALALLFTHYWWISVLISMRTYGGIMQIKRNLLKHISK